MFSHITRLNNWTDFFVHTILIESYFFDIVWWITITRLQQSRHCLEKRLSCPSYLELFVRQASVSRPIVFSKKKWSEKEKGSKSMCVRVCVGVSVCVWERERERERERMLMNCRKCDHHLFSVLITSVQKLSWNLDTFFKKLCRHLVLHF